MQKTIKSMIKESVDVKMLVSKNLASKIEDSIKLIVEVIKSKKKVLIAGNGGSASQASHIAGEFVGRYKMERRGLPCIALTADTTVLTAWSNDYNYETVFSRELEALGSEGDVFIALSTSGNSKNLVKALEAAKRMNLKTISLLGKGGGKMKSMSDIEMIVPSSNTPRVQEAHLMVLHIMCELIDEELFGKS